MIALLLVVTEAVALRCPMKKVFLEILKNSQTPVPESLCQ